MSGRLDQVRIGLAGLGKMGLLHGAVFNALPGSQVVAVAEPATLVRQGAADMLPGVRFHAAVEEMLDAGGLDAVVITTPVALHIPHALACVRRGLPFFVEKPLAASAAQAEELVHALRERPVPHMIGFMTRFVDAFEKGRALVQSGCLGRIQRVTASIYVSQLFARGKGWRYDPKLAGGGVLLSQGAHLLDLLTWYFGPVARVNGQTQCVYSAQVEDFAHVVLEFTSGLRGWMDSSWSVRHRRVVQATIEALGDNGSLTVTDDGVRLFLDSPAVGLSAGWSVWTAVDLYRPVPFDVGGPQYTREDQAFLAVLLGAGAPGVDVLQALHVQRIVDAAYASAEKEGVPVSVRT